MGCPRHLRRVDPAGGPHAVHVLLERARGAGNAGANSTGPELWKYLQQAYLGYRIMPVLTVSGGLFLSPVGPESMVVHENWNWSRSDLFFGCPFYHTGVRAEYALTPAWTFTLAAYNGWNSVVDNNNQKSLSVQAKYTRPSLTVSALYFGGVERPSGSDAGEPWRNLFDSYFHWTVNAWLALMGQVNAGFEDNDFGTSRWAAGALSGRFQLWERLFLADARRLLPRIHAPERLGPRDAHLLAVPVGVLRHCHPGRAAQRLPRADARVSPRPIPGAHLLWR